MANPWLEVSRACTADIRESSRHFRRGPSGSRSSAAARAATTRPRSTRRRRTRSSGGSRGRARASSSCPRSSGRRCSARRADGVVVDPIDGSINAKRGIPFFSFSLAVADGPTMGDVTVGYVHDFGSGEEWTAERGKGAFLNGEPARRRPPEGGARDPLLRGDDHACDRGARAAARRARGTATGDGIARALPLPSGRRTSRRRLLAEDRSLGGHRCRAAPRPRGSGSRSSSSTTRRSPPRRSTSLSGPVSWRPGLRTSSRDRRGAWLMWPSVVPFGTESRAPLARHLWSPCLRRRASGVGEGSRLPVWRRCLRAGWHGRVVGPVVGRGVRLAREAGGPGAVLRPYFRRVLGSVAYWVPSAGVLRVVPKRPRDLGAATSRRDRDAHASGRLAPAVCSSAAAKVAVDGYPVRRSQATYLRLFTMGTPVARAVGAKGWLAVDFRGAESPWRMRMHGCGCRDSSRYLKHPGRRRCQIPLRLAQRIRLRLPLTG